MGQPSAAAAAPSGTFLQPSQQHGHRAPQHPQLPTIYPEYPCNSLYPCTPLNPISLCDALKSAMFSAPESRNSRSAYPFKLKDKHAHFIIENTNYGWKCMPPLIIENPPQLKSCMHHGPSRISTIPSAKQSAVSLLSISSSSSITGP